MARTDVTRGERKPVFDELEPRLLLSGTSLLVNSLSDVVASDGVVTLREAIEAANTNAVVHDAAAGSAYETDIISFDRAALQAEAGAGNDLVITLGGTQLRITDDLTITGFGAGELTIDANGLSRVMFLHGGRNEVQVSGLTLTGGQVTGNGGAIFNAASDFTLADCVVSGNSASNRGGGIFINGAATLTLTNTTVAGNFAGKQGGGISGAVTLNNSIVSQNYAPKSADIYGKFQSYSSIVGGDPGFVRNPSAGADGVWGTEDDDCGDLHLQMSSTAINAGDNDLMEDAGTQSEADSTGDVRIVYEIVDMGALEFGLLPGDADLDGDVDEDDFNILKSNFFAGTTWEQGDFDGDHDVDLTDFNILKSNMGAKIELDQRVEPAAEPIVEPAAEPIVEPAAEPIVEPAAEPIVEPVVEDDSIAPVQQDNDDDATGDDDLNSVGCGAAAAVNGYAGERQGRHWRNRNKHNNKGKSYEFALGRKDHKDAKRGLGSDGVFDILLLPGLGGSRL